MTAKPKSKKPAESTAPVPAPAPPSEGGSYTVEKDGNLKRQAHTAEKEAK